MQDSIFQGNNERAIGVNDYFFTNIYFRVDLYVLCHMVTFVRIRQCAGTGIPRAHVSSSFLRVNMSFIKKNCEHGKV